MEKNTGRQTKVFLIILYFVLAALAVYFVLPKLLVVFMPFICAYVISLITAPLVRLLHEKCRLPKGLAAGISTFVTITVISGIVYFIVYQLVGEIKNISENWPLIVEKIKASGAMLWERVTNYYYSLAPDMQGYLATGYDAIKNEIASLLKPIADMALNFATGFAAGLPNALIFVIVMFLASFFMSCEQSKLRAVVQRIVGVKVYTRVSHIISDLKHALGGYIKAQATIMLIVSIPLSIGLYIAGVPYFVLIAVGISIFDALPVFGSGGILIPWSIIGFLLGDTKTGIVMLVLYLIIVVIRQTLEPRIVGHHIGVPPLITLIAMYAGLKFFGIFGMILGPVLALILKNLYTAGVFDRIFYRRRAQQDGTGSKIDETDAAAEQNDEEGVRNE